MADKTQQIRSIVKYKNRLNSIPLRQFNPTEMDLFFSIAAQVRDRGSETITLSFKQLQKLSTYHRSIWPMACAEIIRSAWGISLKC